MVVGDVVNGIGLDSTLFSFQPAAGVEVIVTHMAINSGWYSLGTTAGVGTGKIYYGSNNAQPSPSIQGGTKICINNTNFLYFNASAGFQANFSGIQIK